MIIYVRIYTSVCVCICMKYIQCTALQDPTKKKCGLFEVYPLALSGPR